MAQHGYTRGRKILTLPVFFLVAVFLLGSCTFPITVANTGNYYRDVNDSSVSVLEMRIHGSDSKESPPFMRFLPTGGRREGAGNERLTIEFELRSQRFPNLALHLIHCDRYWRPTHNAFVQDPSRLRAFDFDIQRAPIGVRFYDYECSITFPRSGSRIQIDHSGNYLARIVDYDSPEIILGEARFYVIEGNCVTRLNIASDFYVSAQTETPQHGLRIFVETEPSVEIFGSQIEAIALVENGMWHSPLIADNDLIDDRALIGRPWLRWYPSFTGKVAAEFRNIPAGNEHRILDLTDVIGYPSIPARISTPLSDLPRRGFVQYDNNGIALSRLVPSGDEDYVNFEFKLDLLGKEVEEDIVVVGTFSNWLALPQWRMKFDSISRYYTAHGYLRRAVHEYQFVVGRWESHSGVLESKDATLLEGNVRQTSTIYHALVYYRESSAGGYDRIVGVGTSVTGSN